MPQQRSRVKKSLYVTLGTISLVLGVIGIPLPILPTTPFLLLAAACYMRGSERLHAWLLGHSVFGRIIKSYKEGVSFRSKVTAISILWLTICLSAFFFVENIYIQIVMLLVAFIVSVHIIRLKPLR
jgi:hypothetical protein